jgi:hypothetical protein
MSDIPLLVLNLFGYIPRRLRHINNIYCYYDTPPLGAGLFIRCKPVLLLA